MPASVSAATVAESSMRQIAEPDGRHDPVVITGIGLVCSLGSSVEEVWDALLAGRSGIREIERFDARGFACSSAAEVSGLDARTLGVDPRDSRIMDMHSFMLMKAVRDALGRSGLDRASVPREEIALFAGMGMVDYRIDDLLPAVVKSRIGGDQFGFPSFYSEGYKEIHPLWPLSMLNNISFCQVAISLDIQGENTVFSPDADSGISAVAEAMMALREGTAVAALAAGVSETISPASLARAELSGLLLTGGIGRVMPFDRDRHGTALGEGCGVLAMELLSAAERRGAAPLAELKACGRAFGSGDGVSVPTSSTISSAIEKALAAAHLNAADIDAIIAHGDGTVSGDGNEMEAMERIFGGCGRTIPVYSSKGSLGHTLAAAPVLDIVLAIRMLGSGTIPALSTAEVPGVSPVFTLSGGEGQKMTLRRVLINGRSSEGQAASLILEKVGG